MLKRTLFACVLLSIVAMPAPAFAWGTAAHRFIMGRAIDILPAEIKPFFEHFREELLVRTVDPDTYRVVGWEDDPNHFVDFGATEFGPYPFTALPREYGAAIEKFGVATLRRLGLLPWREAEEFGNLRRAMENFNRNFGSAPADVVLFTGVAAHYIQDATQPLHASINYDGVLTKQNGVHARFETALFARYQSKLAPSPAPPRIVPSARDFAFDELLKSYQDVEPLLAADKGAIAGKDTYDDEYFDKFFAKVRPMLEERMSSGITATASIILSAWDAAGRPMLRTEIPPTVQKVR
jgi:hypothetical protein